MPPCRSEYRGGALPTTGTKPGTAPGVGVSMAPAPPARDLVVVQIRADLEPLGPEQRRDMLEIVEDRYGRGATLITSQIPVDRWHDLIGEPTLADAILDRIIHNAHRLQLRGDSLRKQKAPKIAAA